MIDAVAVSKDLLELSRLPLVFSNVEECQPNSQHCNCGPCIEKNETSPLSAVRCVLETSVALCFEWMRRSGASDNRFFEARTMQEWWGTTGGVECRGLTC